MLSGTRGHHDASTFPKTFVPTCRKRASKWNLNLICCDVTLSRANWRLLWSKPSTWTLFAYPLGPGGLHYKRPHYLWVTQSNLQALLVSKLGRSDLCMLMSHPLCRAGRVLGQRDSDNWTKPKCISVFSSRKANEKFYNHLLTTIIDYYCVTKVLLFLAWLKHFVSHI